MPDPVWLIIGLVIGVSLTFILELYREWRTKRRLLKALFTEIQSNASWAHQIVDPSEARRQQSQGNYSYSPLTFMENLKTLRFDAYQRAKEHGFLAELPDELSRRMQNIYGIIYNIHEGNIHEPEHLIVNWEELPARLDDSAGELSKYLKLKGR
jgi:hypothetical protein